MWTRTAFWAALAVALNVANATNAPTPLPVPAPTLSTMPTNTPVPTNTPAPSALPTIAGANLDYEEGSMGSLRDALTQAIVMLAVAVSLGLFLGLGNIKQDRDRRDKKMKKVQQPPNGRISVSECRSFNHRVRWPECVTCFCAPGFRARQACAPILRSLTAAAAFLSLPLLPPFALPPHLIDPRVQRGARGVAQAAAAGGQARGPRGEHPHLQGEVRRAALERS